jgi:hypothetical protein
MTNKILLTALGIAGIALALMIAPDIKRYIRISTM